MPGTLAALSPAEVGLLAAGIALTLVWMALTVGARVVSQPRSPRPGPPTSDLGPEPPAVVNLLVRNFRVRPEAVPATLLDLAARKAGVELEQTHPGGYACRLLAVSGDRSLAPYETMVLDLLRGRASGGVVPAGALTTGPEEESSRWFRRFAKEVVRDAQARGLSRDLWDRRTLTILYVASALPAIPFGLAFGWAPFWFAVLAGPAIIGGLDAGGRQRDTPAGLEAAGRWLGVRAKLDEDPILPTVPPTAVAVWERYLGYGAAVGVARGAAAALPMGAESDRRAWSAFGGPWREVRIRYPGRLLPPGWGLPPAVALVVGLGALLAGGFVLFLVVQAGWFDGGADTPSAVVDGIRVAEVIGALAAGLALVWGAVALVFGLFDLGPAATITGRVLRLRARGSDESRRYYVAVDPGGVPAIRAWAIGPVQFTGLDQGQDVRAVVTRYLGHIRSIEPTA